MLPISATIRGRSLVILAGVLWSLAGVFIKSLELSPLTITFYRSLFASLFFLLFSKKTFWPSKFHLLISVISYSTAISAFVWATKLTSAANAIVLQYSAPIFVYFFVRFLFRERVSKLNLQTLFLGMIGITIIFVGNGGKQDFQGVLIATVSGLLFAIYMINLRFLKNFNPIVLTFANNLICCLFILPFANLQMMLSRNQLSALILMGIIQLGIPYFLFSKALEILSLQEASLIVLIEPVLNPIWVALVVGEIPSQNTLIGGVVILISLALRYLRSTEH